MEDRLIVLYDCGDKNFLARTDAPEEIIEEAIEYKNEKLLNDDPNFRSDFEEMQEYVWSEGYNLDEVGYIEDLESYEW